LSLYRERHPDGPEPAVRWLPFQLNPDLPESGIPREEYVARKFGARGKGVNERVTLAGRQVGIPFAYEKMKVQPNTLNAHRLMLHAERAGRQDELAEELFRAHFTEGANLTDRADVEARSAGIGGVPFFIFNRKVGVSGAQDPENLLDAMEQALEEQREQ
jgi:predicted DsbA family dithiol-disulfide isomerase